MDIVDKFVKVDVPKTTRNYKKLPKEKFLKEAPLKPQAIMRGKNWRTEMGKLGLMLKSDYDKGEFASYGLDEKRIMGNIKSEQLEGHVVDLQNKVAELEAKLAEKPNNKEVNSGKEDGLKDDKETDVEKEDNSIEK